MNDNDISITYGPEAGDCTRPYYITLKRKDITVDEFIKWVLKQTREWGYISIGGKNPFKSDYSLEYKYGVVKANGIIPKGILTSVISEASGSGGWTRSDYQLTIKKEAIKMNDDITNTRHVNSASVDEYCREHDLVLVSRKHYNELIDAYRKLRVAEESVLAPSSDYPFDPNVPEMGQL